MQQISIRFGRLSPRDPDCIENATYVNMAITENATRTCSNSGVTRFHAKSSPVALYQFEVNDDSRWPPRNWTRSHTNRSSKRCIRKGCRKAVEDTYGDAKFASRTVPSRASNPTSMRTFSIRWKYGKAAGSSVHHR